MSFIPGPWRVASSNDGDLCVAPDTGNKFDVPICVMPMIVRLSVNEANANLIASAPETHDAASNLMPDLYAWATEKNIGRAEWDRRKTLVDALASALAKARGQ